MRDLNKILVTGGAGYVGAAVIVQHVKPIGDETQELLAYFKNGHSNEHDSLFLPTLNNNPVDTTAGPGNALLVGHARGASVGPSTLKSPILASILSSIAISRIGNIPIKIDEFKKILFNLGPSINGPHY